LGLDFSSPGSGSREFDRAAIFQTYFARSSATYKNFYDKITSLK
jgi:hypothetical protein